MAKRRGGTNCNGKEKMRYATIRKQGGLNETPTEKNPRGVA